MAIALTSTVRRLEAKLAGPVATNQLDIIVQYRDSREEKILIAFGTELTTTDNTTPVVILDHPRAGITRTVSALQAINKDTAPVTLTLTYDNGGIEFVMFKVTLSIGDIIIYEDKQGFYVMTSAGEVKAI